MPKNKIAAVLSPWTGNPGDRLIGLGSVELLSVLNINSVIINKMDRHPLKGNFMSFEPLGFSTSPACYNKLWEYYDYFVVAGTPDLNRRWNHWFYNKAKEMNKPLIGLGYGARLNSDGLQKHDYIYYRQGGLSNFDVFPCPAYFAFLSKKRFCRYSMGKILFNPVHVASYSSSCNKEFEDYQYNLMKGLDYDILCQYPQDYIHSRIENNRKSINFVDWFNLFDILSEYSCVITTRVHTAVFCLSIGMPVVLIKRDYRHHVLEGIGTIYTGSEDINALIESSIKKASSVISFLQDKKTQVLNRIKEKIHENDLR